MNKAYNSMLNSAYGDKVNDANKIAKQNQAWLTFGLIQKFALLPVLELMLISVSATA